MEHSKLSGKRLAQFLVNPSPNKLPFLGLGLVTLACLLPFIRKAFNVDDPLFLWAAQQIQSHPLDFYGFSVNWIGTAMPMTEAMFNPPLTSYFIALVAYFAGEKEVTLHLAFLVPALAAIWGSYLVSKKFCRVPFLAAVVALLSPAFLVSATSVMSDVMMLAFWVWALYLWMHGLDTKRTWLLVLSVLLVGLGVLTKYFAISLVPLLFVYTVIRERRVGAWAALLLIPVLILAGFEWLGLRLYGTPMFLGAARFSSDSGSESDLAGKFLIGLSFVGGAMLPAIIYMPLLWRPRKRAALAGAGLIVLGGLLTLPQVGPHLLHTAEGVRWPVILQLALFISAGLQILLLAVLDVRRYKDSAAGMLLLWVGGTFLFSVLFNWTINVRSLLAMAPAVAILVMRRVEDQHPQARVRQVIRRHGVPIMIAAGFGLLLAWSDYRWANSVRTVATAICVKYRCSEGPVWIDGHWGFQYYMQEHGALEIDWKRPLLKRGQTIVLPLNNNYVAFPLAKESLLPAERFAAFSWKRVATMNSDVGAGYYSDLHFGPLPFAIGSPPPDLYMVATLR